MSRNDLSLRLLCKECGERLSVEYTNQIGVTCDNASSLAVTMKVDPCKRCKERAEKPVRLLSDAMKILNGE